jgi:RimJ/RimL family protein N-acetyltransferase
MKDLENLRNWKNLNKQYFFFQGEISEEGQRIWFGQYLSRPNDYMFMVEACGKCIGCMGIRIDPQEEAEWDVYNVILGLPEQGRKGYMSQALYMMCSWAHKWKQLPIRAKVLSANPALSWYCHNDFGVISHHDDYVRIELDKSVFLLNPNAPQVNLSSYVEEAVGV